jgi:hypothetical protein
MDARGFDFLNLVFIEKARNHIRSRIDLPAVSLLFVSGSLAATEWKRDDDPVNQHELEFFWKKERYRRHERKERGKIRESEVKKVGDRERGKGGRKNGDSDLSTNIHRSPSRETVIVAKSCRFPLGIVVH